MELEKLYLSWRAKAHFTWPNLLLLKASKTAHPSQKKSAVGKQDSFKPSRAVHYISAPLNTFMDIHQKQLKYRMIKHAGMFFVILHSPQAIACLHCPAT